MSSLTAVQKIGAALRKELERSEPGASLPSVRELVKRYRVSPVTVSQAVAELRNEGLVVAQPGRGTFIAARPSRPAVTDLAWQTIALGPRLPSVDLERLVADPPPGTLPLASGYMSVDLQPVRELARVMNRVVKRHDAWDRAPVDGIAELRDWFARRAGGGVTARDVMIVQGGQSAISTVMRAVARPGDPMLFESPTYVGALAVARSLGVNVVPVPSDAEGLRPDLLAQAFATSGARVLYCQPAHANPTGTCFSAERREAVLAVVRTAGAFVIEDDFARDLTFAETPPPTLLSSDDGHVIYVRSLTKFVAPSLRVAAVCARGAVMARLRAARVLDDFFVPRLLQEAALAFTSSSACERHLRTLRHTFAERMHTALAAVREHLPEVRITSVPTGGYCLWLALPPGTDDVEFARRALSAGVAVNAGTPWFPAEPSGPFFRVSVAGATPLQLRTGIEKLRDVLRQ